MASVRVLHPFVRRFVVNENEVPSSDSEPKSEASKKRHRGAIIVAIAMALGLLALIALNMN